MSAFSQELIFFFIYLKEIENRGECEWFCLLYSKFDALQKKIKNNWKKLFKIFTSLVVKIKKNKDLSVLFEKIDDLSYNLKKIWFNA